MNAPIGRLEPAMSELNTSNHLMGDQAALRAAWERDGYWFFRGVLDINAVERYRTVFLDELERLGVINPGDRDAIYNGASLDGFPFRMDPLAERKIYRQFIGEPAIERFFRSLLQDGLFWVPTVEYRATPPSRLPDQKQFDYIHEDGVYNHGIPFRICWVPLSVIDARVGGLALGEALHRGPTLHQNRNGNFPEIDLDAIPAHAWRRTTYRPGDVLLMDMRTPHSGIVNRSDRFRLSMDIRLCAASDNTPIVGEVIDISSETITVRNETETRTAQVTNDTFTRDLVSRRIRRDELASFFRVGTEVILGTEHGLATVIRPPH